jgi:nitroreductase
MNAQDAILARKSVRAYKAEQITGEELKALVDAGLSGPGGGAVHLSVIQKADIIQRINDVTKAGMLASGNDFAVSRASLPGYEPVYGAPLLLLLSAPDPNGAVNCACAAENMLIAATALGLGSCFLMSIRGAFSGEPGPALLAECGIPEGNAICCGVIAGYPDGDKFSSSNRKVRTVNYVK